MPPDLQQLVRDTVELTGAAPPRVLEADAPTLVLDPQVTGEVYLVGLIGGKEVGKSAMVNALAGQPIAAVTSHGAGTDAVMAYVHASREPAVRQLLERVAPGQHRIVTHELAGADPNRVLLDLPDIDSHFQSHLALTRRMLRHMLFPVWIVSIEKYADQQPRQMLARVAEGNDPRNFVFVLNKADQLRGDTAAATEIRDDYARRVAAVTGIEPPPRVYVVSARDPKQFDLPELRKSLVRQRSRDEVAVAGQRAHVRRDRSIVGWMTTQNLPERAQRMARLRNETEELLTARVVGPLLETAIPRLAGDAVYRAALVDEAMDVRAARWPLVNLVHTMLSPLLGAALAIVRGGGRITGLPAQGWVDPYLATDARPLHAVLQSTFAHVRQTSPAVVDLYTSRRPWEDRDAELAVIELRSALVDTVERQRAHLVTRYGRSRNPLAAMVRWLLTVGALLWFPFVQPLLEVGLQPGFGRTTQELGLLVVRLLGTSYLLTTVSFLILYFIVLWLVLRWRTGRRVGQFLTSWGSGRGPEELDFSRQVVTWGQGLVGPLRNAQEKTERVARDLEMVQHAT